MIGLVEGQPFFTTIAGLSVSLAGFGAVIAWLRDDPTGWDPINLWRVRTIVRHALTIAFLCLALIPIQTFTDNDRETLRFGSAMFLGFVVFDMWRSRHRDPEVWDPAGSWLVYMGFNAVLGLACLANVLIASLGLLQITVLIILTSPAAIFLNFMRELGGSKPAAETNG